MKLENVMAGLENFGSEQNRQTYKKHGVENEMFIRRIYFKGTREEKREG